LAMLLESSVNAGVIAAFQPVVVRHFDWDSTEIATVNMAGAGLAVFISVCLAQMRLPERLQAAGAALIYLAAVLMFTLPPLEPWKAVVGLMLGLKAQILFMAPFTAMFSHAIGRTRVTNKLTTALCLAPLVGAAMGTAAAPWFVEQAGQWGFAWAAAPAALAICGGVAGWSRVAPRDHMG